MTVMERPENLLSVPGTSYRASGEPGVMFPCGHRQESVNALCNP